MKILTSETKNGLIKVGFEMLGETRSLDFSLDSTKEEIIETLEKLEKGKKRRAEIAEENKELIEKTEKAQKVCKDLLK